SVSGRYIDDLNIEVYNYLGSFDPIYEKLSGVDGDCAIINIDPGVYSIGVIDDYLTYPTIFYEHTTHALEADPIEIEPSSPETTYIEFSMVAFTSTVHRVMGQIRNEIGEPIPHCYVIAISDDEVEEYSYSARGDAEGHYEMMLPEGEYYLLARSHGYVPEFYREAYSWDEVPPLVVDRDLEGIDIELGRVLPADGAGFIEFSVLGEMPGFGFTDQPIKGARVYLQKNDGSGMYSEITDYNGLVRFENVILGSYTVIVDKIDFEMVDSYLGVTFSETDSVLGSTTIRMQEAASKIDENDNKLPSNYALHTYPNPFNASASISFVLDSESDIELNIFDVEGRLQKSIFSGKVNSGQHTFTFNGDKLSTGLFIISLEADGSLVNREKILLIK
ncbi:MAG TPA: T9SS type A sorting domain-containing protein, partial [Alphaproteobacteria bacterium]|nr:T9SS type A sorting domain-containing protein [Alphaproteobacteria bacterium]